MKEIKKMICDVVHCNGAFFDEHVYIEHVRHIHLDCARTFSDENCSVVELKDAMRTVPTQTGPRPASKKKEYTLLRIQCLEGQCKESNSSYFPTRARYNKHVADIHKTSAIETMVADDKKRTTPELNDASKVERGKSPKKSEAKSASNQSAISVEVHHSSTKSANAVESRRRSGRRQSAETDSGPVSGDDDDDEPTAKKSKTDDDRLREMMSESSYTRLLNSLGKGSPKTSTPTKGAAKESPASETSPRRKEAAKKVSKCEVCRDKFGALVDQCLCTKADMHKTEAQVKLKALRTSVVSQV